MYQINIATDLAYAGVFRRFLYLWVSREKLNYYVLWTVHLPLKVVESASLS